MSWKIREKHRRILASESGAVLKNPGGKLTVALVYPNHYRIGMGNLGFQTLYRILNDLPDVACERAFLPDPEEAAEYARSRTSLLSLESSRPLSEFDLIAFSVSFENDYLHIPAILRQGGIAPYAGERTEADPLVVAGGAALFLNPEPAAGFLDLVCIGEAEPLLPSLLRLVRQDLPRRSMIEQAAKLPGLYVPSLYDLGYEGGIFTRLPLKGAPSTVSRVWDQDAEREPASSVIAAPDVEFSDMHLVEISRGCPRGCRFCAAGFIYLPYRQRGLAQVLKETAAGLEKRERIGLVGAAVSDYREIGRLCRHIIESGGKISVSSLRLDALDEEMIAMLKGSGHKTIALAPEGGSQRMRDMMKKGLTETQILDACDRLTAAGILNLKLYFIIGLPGENDDDLQEMVSLVERIRGRVIDAARANRRLGEIVLSVNPFVPKPFTPFQWFGMEEMKSLEKKFGFLKKEFGRLSNVRLQMESPREAYLQAVLSRGDRRLSGILVGAVRLADLKKAAKSAGIDLDAYAYRTIPLEELLPWDFIEHDRKMLEAEYRKALSVLGR